MLGMLGWRRALGPLTVGAIFALGLGVLGIYRAYRVVRIEAACFHPRRGPVPLPAILADVPGRHDVEWRACDGIAIRGWYFPSKNGAAVLLAHGSENDRRQLAPEARALADEGFGVLAFDLPGHGESEGRVTFGRCEVDALRQATSFLAAQPDVDPARIGGIGLSIGAALLAIAAAEEPRLHSLVLMSPFADSVEQTQNEVARLNWLAQWGTLAVDRHFMKDGPLRPVDAVRALGGRPLLVVAVADDQTVPLAMTRQVYDAADARKDMVLVPSGGHANVAVLASGECGDRVLQFCRETLLSAVSAGGTPAAHSPLGH